MPRPRFREALSLHDQGVGQKGGKLHGVHRDSVCTGDVRDVGHGEEGPASVCARPRPDDLRLRRVPPLLPLRDEPADHEQRHQERENHDANDDDPDDHRVPARRARQNRTGYRAREPSLFPLIPPLSSVV